MAETDIYKIKLGSDTYNLPFLPLSGGTLSGNITLGGGNAIIGSGNSIPAKFKDSASINPEVHSLWLGAIGTGSNNTAGSEASGILFDGNTIKMWSPLDNNPLIIDSDNGAEHTLLHSGNITKDHVGLGNVDNTADANKSVNYATTAGSAPASDVYAWAKAANKPTYKFSEITEKIVASNEFNFLDKSYSQEYVWINYAPQGTRDAITKNVAEFKFANGNSAGGFANLRAKGFIKNGKDDNDVLLAGGGSKALSDFSMAHSHPYWTWNAADVAGVKVNSASAADSATSATNDSDGNAINSTYLKLAGGTLTGALTFGDGAQGMIKYGTYTTSGLKGITLPGLGSAGIGIFSRASKSTDEGGIIITEDSCLIYNSFDSGWGFSIHDKDLNQADISSDATKVFGITQNNYYAWSRGGYKKEGSSDSYVLLGGGGHKAVSDFLTSLPSHNHDNRYYTETEVDNAINTECQLAFEAALSYADEKLAGKSDIGHTHSKSEITDFPTSLPANGGTATYAGRLGTSSSYHTKATIDTAISTNCQAAHEASMSYADEKLAGKSDIGHTHSKSEITDFPTSLPANGGTALYAGRLGTSSSYHTKATLDTALAGKADSSHGTHVSSGAQTWAGVKTFSSAPVFSAGFTSGGNVTVTGKVSASSGFYEESDERLKSFKDPIKVDLEKLYKLRKSYFTFNSDPDNLQIGVSAQEIQSLYPELVAENENGNLTVAYDKLSVIALAAVDQLSEENTKLKQQNEEILKRLEKIEKLLSI